MTQNSGTLYAWKRSVESLPAADESAWQQLLRQSEALVAERKRQLDSTDRNLDIERQELLDAEAFLFTFRVKKLGYEAATNGRTGPAVAQESTRQLGVTDSNGKDIENPT
jgi:hypothetical protein